jgi:glyoxylase-like metal-dependent hydrolase (beta-lactamase superfamily II)
MDKLKLGKTTLTWLNGGTLHFDGGAMFGAVPKALWSKKYPCNDKNQIRMKNDPIYFEINNKKIIIDSGLGHNKLTSKQKRNFGCTEESHIEKSLQNLGIKPDEIDFVLMTHMHFDHSCGLTTEKNAEYEPFFPGAKIVLSKVEWDEVRKPNIRSKSSYWEKNWEAVKNNVITFDDSLEVLPGLQMIRTGGHSSGHSIILLENNGEKFIHLGDLAPLHTHLPSLWVSAYDDYPMDSITAKEKWIKYGKEKDFWFTFYHDSKYRAVKINNENKIISSIEVK